MSERCKYSDVETCQQRISESERESEKRFTNIHSLHSVPVNHVELTGIEMG